MTAAPLPPGGAPRGSAAFPAAPAVADAPPTGGASAAAAAPPGPRALRAASPSRRPTRTCSTCGPAPPTISVKNAAAAQRSRGRAIGRRGGVRGGRCSRAGETFRLRSSWARLERYLHAPAVAQRPGRASAEAGGSGFRVQGRGCRSAPREQLDVGEEGVARVGFEVEVVDRQQPLQRGGRARRVCGRVVAGGAAVFRRVARKEG